MCVCEEGSGCENVMTNLLNFCLCVFSVLQFESEQDEESTGSMGSAAVAVSFYPPLEDE